MLGDVLQPPIPPEFGKPVTVAIVDPRQACAMALRAYLEPAVFRVWPGEEGAEVREFQITEFLTEWPDPAKELPYPCASIVDVTDVTYEAHHFTPTMLEETYEAFAPRTVLWKVGELDHLFQVDWWLNTAPDREAVAARLPGLFSPGESRSGVLLEGPEAYFCRSVRAILESSRRMDTQESTYAAERRLMTRVRVAIDVVELREAVTFQPSTCVVVEDPNDPEPSEET